MKKLAIVTTHPVQYYDPFFKLLATKGVELKVFYTWGEQSINKYDPGFKRIIKWDLPLLDGYYFEFLENKASDPGSHHFRGIQNIDAILKIRSFAPDAILVFGWCYQSHLAIIRHFKSRIPVWFRGDSTLLDNQNGLKKRIRLHLLKWIYSHVDKAFYVGSNNKDYFRACGLREDQLVFSPHAVDNARFSIDRSEEAMILRQSLEIGEGEIIILFAGKLEEKKGPILLLEAFIELENPKLTLLFVGNGILENQLKALANESKSRVKFMDFQNQEYMPVIYQACDLFCLPSKGPGETWGLAVNEAMASGKAVLVSDKVGCGRDLVNPGVNGDVFLHNVKGELVKKMARIVESDDLCGFGKKSKAMIQAWNFDRSVDSIISTINKLD